MLIALGSWLWRIALTLPLVGLVSWLVLTVQDPGVDPAGPSPTDDVSRPLMVAIGDSFIAGEGAPPYLAGTSNKGNGCHRSNESYPYAVARELNYRLVNATCSGARTFHLTDVPDHEAEAQHPSSPDDVWGGVPQLDALTHPRINPDEDLQPGEVSLVLLSIGGNDAGFGEIVTNCLRTDCARHERDTLRDVEAVEPRLAQTYAAVRRAAPNARVVVVLYPSPIVVSNCVLGLSRAETHFLSRRLLPALDDIIAFQAERAGFEVVDTREAFAGARPCEPGVTADLAAMNTLQLAKGEGGMTGAEKGSFHPTAVGYKLLAQAVLDHLANSSSPSSGPGGPPRPPDFPPGGGPPGGGPPGEGPTGAPPHPDDMPPESDAPAPADAPCPAAKVDRQNVRQIARGIDTEEVRTLPGAPVCLQVPGEPWTAVEADADGLATVEVGELSRAEIPTLRLLWQSPQGRWQLQTLIAPADLAPPAAAWWERLDVWLLVGGGIACLLCVPLLVAVFRTIRTAVERVGSGGSTPASL